MNWTVVSKWPNQGAVAGPASIRIDGKGRAYLNATARRIVTEHFVVLRNGSRFRIEKAPASLRDSRTVRNDTGAFSCQELQCMGVGKFPVDIVDGGIEFGV